VTYNDFLNTSLIVLVSVGSTTVSYILYYMQYININRFSYTNIDHNCLYQQNLHLELSEIATLCLIWIFSNFKR